MGRLTETFAYLNAKPNSLLDIVFEFRYITITDNLRLYRRYLKWYNKNKINQLELDF